MSDSPDWLDIFQEPPDFFERKREFAFESFRLASGEEVSLRLVGHSPLWVRQMQVSQFRMLCLGTGSVRWPWAATVPTRPTQPSATAVHVYGVVDA